jgi:hypothetical protein
MIFNQITIENSNNNKNNQATLTVTELEDWQLLATSFFTFITSDRNTHT